MDEAEEEKIKIIFDRPYLVLSTFFFTYEGNGDFISLVTGSEALKLSKMYNVIQGNLIYKLTNTNINGNMYVIARGIEAQIVD